MEGVSFEEEIQPQQNNRFASRPASSMTGFLIAKGIAKNEQEAAYFLIGSCIVLIIVGIGVWALSGTNAKRPPTEVQTGMPIAPRS